MPAHAPESAENFAAKGFALLEGSPGAEDIGRYGAYMLMYRQHPGHYEQQGNCESRYADVLGEALAGRLRAQVEKTVGARLLPSHSMSQIFTRGAEIVPREAAPAEEISVIVALGAKGAEAWPMWVLDTGIAEDRAVALDSLAGAAWVLDTQRLQYRREAFAGEYWLQLVLCYVRAEGPFAHYRFDGRRGLGEPPNRGQQDRNIELRKAYDAALAGGDDGNCFCQSGSAYSVCHGRFEQTLTA